MSSCCHFPSIQLALDQQHGLSLLFNVIVKISTVVWRPSLHPLQRKKHVTHTAAVMPCAIRRQSLLWEVGRNFTSQSLNQNQSRTDADLLIVHVLVFFSNNTTWQISRDAAAARPGWCNSHNIGRDYISTTRSGCFSELMNDTTSLLTASISSGCPLDAAVMEDYFPLDG